MKKVTDCLPAEWISLAMYNRCWKQYNFGIFVTSDYDSALKGSCIMKFRLHFVIILAGNAQLHDLYAATVIHGLLSSTLTWNISSSHGLRISGAWYVHIHWSDPNVNVANHFAFTYETSNPVSNFRFEQFSWFLYFMEHCRCNCSVADYLWIIISIDHRLTAARQKDVKVGVMPSIDVRLSVIAWIVLQSIAELKHLLEQRCQL